MAGPPVPTDPQSSLPSVPSAAQPSTNIPPPIVGQLSRKQRRALLKQQTQVTITSQSWAGPLPAPETLAQFNQIEPGLAKIIVDEFQAQAAHRRDLEQRVVRSQTRNTTLGQIFAFTILAGLVAGGVFLIYVGRDAGGLGAIAAAVVSGLWALGAARRAKREDLTEKREGRHAKR